METSKPLSGATSNQLTLFAADGPASHSVSPGNSKGLTMLEICGRSTDVAWKPSSPLGSLVKMCLESSLTLRPSSSLTWKPWGTKQPYLGFRLAPLGPRTGGNGSGLWPTPNARDYKDTGKNTDYGKLKKKCKLAGAVGGPVDPEFAEWLMGYEIGWSELKD